MFEESLARRIQKYPELRIRLLFRAPSSVRDWRIGAVETGLISGVGTLAIPGPQLSGGGADYILGIYQHVIERL